MKCSVKFVAAVLLLSMTTLLNPQPLMDGDPAPICDPTTQICKPPIPPFMGAR